KGLELLKEALPRAQRVMITRDPQHNPSQTLADETAETVAKALGIRLHRVDVRHVADYDAAFEAAVKERVNPALPFIPVSTTGLIDGLRGEIALFSMGGLSCPSHPGQVPCPCAQRAWP